MENTRHQHRDARVAGECEREGDAVVGESKLDLTREVLPQAELCERERPETCHGRDDDADRPFLPWRHVLRRSRVQSRMGESEHERPVRAEHVDASRPSRSWECWQEAERVFREHEAARELPDYAPSKPNDHNDLHDAQRTVAASKY